ncbi:MAG: DUF4440 domain-containing protein [Candidatus Dormibacteria bacterium]
MDKQTTIMGEPLAMATAEPQLAELIREHQVHNDAFYTGTPELEYWVHDDDVTLHGGFDISGRGWNVLQRGLTMAAGRLTEGRITFTPLGGRIVGDLAYLAGFEEGTVRLDGAEPRTMRLRVTSVFQRVEGQWLCVHRHGEMTTSDR